ncbi:MAG: bifunctional 5,10-methylene-tetrahydrofolate dehydrogenase/5,10-methylene-tetrahydrofolate cyclohydrolase [Candidatus Marinimicrobia bacterium]|jgi:methylenetetrahydrofolate dehydrogenase (NADP+) / methenyltetrahydrofolate cyclohydrolase|nr:bifunctional 5,10-methylene-tetrahydrofolate dehydrogenase/5,10-methylene-tetrahydrofolate cyclohydrolase [Candidatus Neomarinimicrobiota bacterium]
MVSVETQILKGKPVADAIKANLSHEVEGLATQNIIPGLAAVLVGDDPASQVYVRSKQRVFEKLSCYSETFRLPAETTETELLALISSLNVNPKFHGILVQLPLPKHINSRNIFLSIDPKKDVDGFHPINLGNLLEGSPQFIPCTPNGVIQILKHYNIPVSGRYAVIVGRSNIVGKPMFALLAQKFEKGNATVTICHTGTPDITNFTKQADIIIAAAGIPHLITGDMISEGVDIIDVGINRVDDDSEKGYHLTGDVQYDSVLGIANSVTPVPGGVGPMTITMLLANTIQSAKNLLS